MASSTKKRAFAALLTNIARLLLSAVLMVSGFVKAVDPMGFTYKLQEYLAAFGLTGIDEGWILAGALSLSAAEFIMGVLLLMGIYKCCNVPDIPVLSVLYSFYACFGSVESRTRLRVFRRCVAIV